MHIDSNTPTCLSLAMTHFKKNNNNIAITTESRYGIGVLISVLSTDERVDNRADDKAASTPDAVAVKAADNGTGYLTNGEGGHGQTPFGAAFSLRCV